jgi:hypothetical protein
VYNLVDILSPRKRFDPSIFRKEKLRPRDTGKLSRFGFLSFGKIVPSCSRIYR